MALVASSLNAMPRANTAGGGEPNIFSLDHDAVGGP